MNATNLTCYAEYNMLNTFFADICYADIVKVLT